MPIVIDTDFKSLGTALKYLLKKICVRYNEKLSQEAERETQRRGERGGREMGLAI